MNSWSFELSKIAIIFSFAVIGLGYAIFGTLMEPLSWSISQLCIIILFFAAFPIVTNQFKNNSKKYLILNLFLLSILLKSFLFGFIYISTLSPHLNLLDMHFPMSLPYPDAQAYHEIASLFAKNILKGDFSLPLYYVKIYGLGPSDYGYPYFLGFVYLLLKPAVISAIIANIILASFSVILIYKITYTIFNCRNSAYLAASIAIFFPYFNYYLGFPLKETLLIFIVLLFFYYLLRIMAYHNKVILNFAATLGLIFLMLYFRTFLSILCFLCFLCSIYLSYGMRSMLITRFLLVFSIGFVCIIIYFLLSMETEKEIVLTFSKRFNIVEGHIDQVNKQIKKKITKKEFLPLAAMTGLIAPLPSFVEIESREMTNIQCGNVFVKNIMIFFAYLGMILSIKQKNRFSVPFIIFFIGYTIVLTISGGVLQQRFQMISLPILVIFMSFGIMNSSIKHYKLWAIYLHGLGIIFLAWNYYKLYIRAMI